MRPKRNVATLRCGFVRYDQLKARSTELPTVKDCDRRSALLISSSSLMKLTPACRSFVLLVSLAAVGVAQPSTPAVTAPATESKTSAIDQPLRIEVSFPASVRAAPASGRVLLFLAPGTTGEPRRPGFARLGPVYAIDVKEVKPGQPITFQPSGFTAPDALAFPMPLGQLAPGSYRIQAVFDLDTTEADYNAGPGNLLAVPKPVSSTARAAARSPSSRTK